MSVSLCREWTGLALKALRLARTVGRGPMGMIVSLVVMLVPCSAVAQSSSFEQPPIDYLNAPVNDPVARLAAQVATGDTTLQFDGQRGYLASVLRALDIPVSSQTLVFSKTSLQLQRISPRRPRAVYFNDEVYVGYCQNGDVLEFAATDPMQGAIFYTLDQTADGPPQFVRDRGSCLTCHASSRTQNVPGYLVRSVFADGSGHPILGSGTFNTDHTSPLEERWGGWYVTGTHGKTRHMGNVLYDKNNARGNRELSDSGSNVTSLEGIVSTEPYLSPHSDLVALLVLEHQAQMHNAIAAANYETRQALHQSYQMNELLERGEGFISESAQRRIDAVAENVVRHLLMSGEIRLVEPVAGTSGFAEEFASRGETDSKGRSLRQLNLRDRVFEYRCSYLIDSPAFAALPDQVRGRIFDRLVAILAHGESANHFDHLTADDRLVLVEMLAERKPEFAERLGVAPEDQRSSTAPDKPDWLVRSDDGQPAPADHADTLVTARHESTYFPPPESEGGWRQVETEEQIESLGGMDRAKVADLRQWLLSSDNRPFAAVVIRRGHIVLQVERGNSAATDVGRVASVSKAICATVLAIASERSRQGQTPRKMDFDDLAFDFIPAAHPLSDPRKSQVTIKQLLNHTSGLCPEALGAENDGTWDYVLGHSGDPRTAQLAFDPGTACGYSTHGFVHAALVCENVTAMRYDQFAIDALFKPLGIENWWFQFYDGGGIGPKPSHGLGLPARDLARIGYCMLRGGLWQDQQVIPRWFIDQTALPSHHVTTPEMRWQLNPAVFTLGWELPALHHPESGKSIAGIPADARYKPGSGGQLVAFVPSLDLVIARQTGQSGPWDYEEFLRRACDAVWVAP